MILRLVCCWCEEERARKDGIKWGEEEEGSHAASAKLRGENGS